MRDLRHGTRSLAASPSFTLVALAVLTLGIGACTIIFSIVDAVVLRPLPFPGADRLVAVGELNRTCDSAQAPNLVAPQNFLDWRERQRVFAGFSAIGYASIRLSAEHGGEPEVLEAQAVTSDFFPVLGVSPLMGRALRASDEVDGASFVAVISFGLWQRRFGGAPDVIGRHLPGWRGSSRCSTTSPVAFAPGCLRIGTFPTPTDRTDGRVPGRRRVVGVVGNMRHEGPETDWRRQGFIPLDQGEAVGATLVLRLSGGAGRVLPAVRAAIWSDFPGLALPDVQTLSEYLRSLVAQRRLNMLLLGLFGLLGIAIACVGVYGVMAYLVAQRTHEIGIRIALGAQPLSILTSMLAEVGSYVVGGLAFGLVGGAVLSSLVAGMLFQVGPEEPWILAGVAVVLGATAVGAALVPARRASRLDPLVALRLD